MTHNKDKPHKRVIREKSFPTPDYLKSHISVSTVDPGHSHSDVHFAQDGLESMPSWKATWWHSSFLPQDIFQPFSFKEPDLAVDPKKRQCFHAKCVGKHLTNKACWSDTWELILERSHIFVKSVVKDSLLAPVLKLTGSYHLTHLCSGYSEIRSKRWTGKQTQNQYCSQIS